MPRKRRLWEPGDILSIVGRGHEGRPLFATDDDRRFFVDGLRRIFVPGAVELHAWSVPFNHFHLLIRVGDVPPGALMHRLNTAIAMRERRLRGEHGAAFQGRYWSGRCEREGSVRSRLSYVIGNPVHHGMLPTASALETYPWTAYPELLGLSTPGIVSPATTLALLHPDRAVARDILRRSICERVAAWQAERAGLDPCTEPGCRGPSDGCDLVHPARLRALRAPGHRADEESDHAQTPWRVTTVSRAHHQRLDRAAALRAKGWCPSDLVVPVCAHFGADPRAVVSGRRTHAESRARAVIAFVACDGVGVTATAIAEILGVGDGAITTARRRGEALVASVGATVDIVLRWPAASAR